MRWCWSWLVVLVVVLTSCSEPKQTYTVGVDPTWYPLKFDNIELDHITAFSTELLSAIGQVESLAFIKITTNWDTFLTGLEKGEYQAILSSMPPYLFNQRLFHFSSPYLLLGPVLVIGEHSSLHSLEKLQGKEIAVITGSSDELILEKSPGVLIRYYDSAASALNAIVNHTIDGALIDRLTATAFLKDLYQQQLKIVSPPLTEEGLRFITNASESDELIQRFNAGLKKLKERGDYDKLLSKWRV